MKSRHTTQEPVNNVVIDATRIESNSLDFSKVLKGKRKLETIIVLWPTK